jgi:sugar/nucleoside kinase (ribokinase family)
MKKVLGLGNALVDILIKINNENALAQFDLPKGSMQLVNNEFSSLILNKTKDLQQHFNSGGSAANTIHGLAKLGIETGYIGKIGDDEYGRYFEDDLSKNNISPHVIKGTSKTGKAIGLITPDSERTFATFLGAAIELTEKDITEAVFAQYDFFHVEGYLVQNHRLIENALKLARQLDMVVSIDLASYNIVEDNVAFIRRLITNYVDIVFANEDEAVAFTEKDPEEAATEISSICELAVVKLGKKGSIVQQGSAVYNIDPVIVDALDTTGAGDLYASGFLYGLIHDLSIEESGKIASTLASKVIEDFGAKITENGWKTISRQLETSLK